MISASQLPPLSQHQNCVIAIDPGYDRIGWAVGLVNSSSPPVIAYGCIRTAKTNDIVLRYQSLEEELTTLIETYHPVELAIETLFFSKNKTTALKVAEARGVILLCCLRHGLNVYEYHPNTIKLTVTGNGKADKAGVEKMIRLQLSLPSQKIIDDAIDALAILLTHSITRR